MPQTALILGAGGRFGRQAAQAFERAGWRLRRFDRARDRLDQAARGADVIVNGWNPAYPDWAAQVPGLHAAVIAAARASGATVILPGNVYVFGPDVAPPWGPDSPHRARNPLGRIRIEMEAAYRRAGLRTILLRAGDFLDTEASGNWFDQILAAKVGRGRFTYPGAPDRAHAWAYLPDLARAAVALAERRAQLPVFADIPFAGYRLTGEEMRAGLERAAGRRLRLRRMNWAPIRLAAPFWPMGRCLAEMRYLWDLPHALDPAPLRALLPDFVATPPDRALEAALAPLRPGLARGAQIDPDQPVSARS